MMLVMQSIKLGIMMYHAASVEDEAHVMIQEMNARHQAELTHAQDVANAVQL